MQAGSTFYVVWATSATFRLHAGNTVFDTSIHRVNADVLLYELIYLCTFLHIMHNKNTLMMIGEIYKKYNSQTRLGCSYSENIFT